MIKAKANDIEITGTDEEVVPEFLAIYKIIEAKYKEKGKNFRSMLLSIIFDAEFEKIQAEKTKSNIINFEEIKRKWKRNDKWRFYWRFSVN